MATRAKQFEIILAGFRDPDTDEPLAGGSVEFYEVGTTTAKDVWTESAKTNAYETYTLDGFGQEELYGDGNYKILVKDSAGELIYTLDEVKCSSNEYLRRTISGATGAVTPEDDAILCNSGSNNIAISLQTVQNYDKPIAFKKTSANNTVTITPYGAETIDGEANRTMTANNTTFSLIPDKDAGMWRVSNHIAIGLVDLTASVTELNQLDGVEVGGNAAGDILTTDGIQTITGVKTFSTGQPIFSTRPKLTGGGLSDGTQNIDFPTNGMAAAKFMLGDSDTITWFYLNTAPPGWKVLATGADTVLAVSGGSDAYNVNGGNQDSVNDWTTYWDHTLTIDEMPEHRHATTDNSGNYLSADAGSGTGPNGSYTGYTGGGEAHNHGRPAASVGKLFQLDTA